MNSQRSRGEARRRAAWQHAGAYRGRAGTPWPRRRAPVFILALVVAVIQVAGALIAAGRSDGARGLWPWGLALMLIGPAALLARRRYPVAVLLTAQGATVLYYGFGYPQGPAFLALAVALATVVMSGRRVLPWILYAAGLAATYGLQWLLAGDPPPVADTASHAAWGFVFLAIVSLIRSRIEQFAEIRRTHEETHRREVSEERLQIARELHDVLAHNVSLMNVQASTALHLFDDDPERARSALAAIKDASKQTLTELRATVGALRQADESAPLTPAPGIDRLDELITQSAGVGLEVALSVSGDRTPLPARVDLAAFRIIQEALTNVRRHSGAVKAAVSLNYGERELDVTITDLGRGVQPGKPTAEGHGLTGMRERALSVGGRLEAVSPASGGFRVRARLPLGMIGG